MTVWIDAQLPPSLAAWLAVTFNVEAASLRDLGLRNASDQELFFAARKTSAIVVTKDADFMRLLEQHGAPPQVVWLTCGNTSNRRLRSLLGTAWPKAMELFARGEPLVEIGA